MKSETKKITLQLFGLPLIESLDDFSRVSRLSKKFLYLNSRGSDSSYITYSIRKKNGKLREISQPTRKLKAIQSWILKNILERLEVSSASKGFKKGDSIMSNALPHLSANVVFSLDLEDFFPSIRGNKVYAVFRTLGYNKHVSALLTSFCTFNNKLPQGGPCSPYLANLICLQLDNRIQGYVGKRGIVYTRYADDLTFSASGAQKLLKTVKTLEKIIESEGFKLNTDKTRIKGPCQRRVVTGLVVTEDSIGIGKNKYRFLRSKFFNLIRDNKESEANIIEGWLAFVKSVDKKRYFKLLGDIKKFQKKLAHYF